VYFFPSASPASSSPFKLPVLQSSGQALEVAFVARVLELGVMQHGVFHIPCKVSQLVDSANPNMSFASVQLYFVPSCSPAVAAPSNSSPRLQREPQVTRNSPLVPATRPIHRQPHSNLSLTARAACASLIHDSRFLYTSHGSSTGPK